MKKAIVLLYSTFFPLIFFLLFFRGRYFYPKRGHIHEHEIRGSCTRNFCIDFQHAYGNGCRAPRSGFGWLAGLVGCRLLYIIALCLLPLLSRLLLLLHHSSTGFLLFSFFSISFCFSFQFLFIIAVVLDAGWVGG